LRGIPNVWTENASGKSRLIVSTEGTKARGIFCFKSILSAHLQDFALAAAGAGQQQTLFAGCFVKAAGQGQTI
jgi:hypothetical protein